MMETSIIRFWILDFGFWIEKLPERRRGSRDRRAQPRGGGAEHSDAMEGGGGAVASRRRGAAGREHAPAIRSEGAGSGGRCGKRSAETARNPGTPKRRRRGAGNGLPANRGVSRHEKGGRTDPRPRTRPGRSGRRSR